MPSLRSARHLRPRGDGGEQRITTVELFFDLVYVFAVTQSSHMILRDLTVAQVGPDYDIDGGHFTDRCQGFIIIALGESIVVTGATAAAAGLTSTVVLCLGIAFLETAALWWLYFGAVADRSRLVMRTSQDPGRLARDAYTYLHAPIVAGIIAVAVGDDLLIAAPGRALHGVGLAMVLGGPVLYLLGESLFRLRMTGAANAKRLAGAAILVLLVPAGSHISALALSATVVGLLSALALWELRTTPPLCALGTRLGSPTDARGERLGDLRHIQQQQEGTS